MASLDHEPSAQTPNTYGDDRTDALMPFKQRSHLSWRAVLFGVVLGALICFANTTFALQSGITYSMTLPSGLLAYGFFKALESQFQSAFTIQENALVIAIASSFGTMPLTIGTSGIVPGLEFLTTPAQGGPFRFSTGKLIVWGVGLSLIGVIIAPPLRNYFVFKEKLRFPAGTSAAILLGLLYKDDQIPKKMAITDKVASADEPEESTQATNQDLEGPRSPSEQQRAKDWSQNTQCIGWAFSYSTIYGLASYFIPVIERIPFFGNHVQSEWAWSFHTSPSYLAMGMLVHTSTSLWLTVGTIIGWGILGPISKHKGWAPGPTRDWETGAQGWILWVALGGILGDSLVYVFIIYGGTLYRASKQLLEFYNHRREGRRSTAVQHSNNEDRQTTEADPLLGSHNRHSRSKSSQDPKDLAISYQELISWVALSAGLSLAAIAIVFRSLLSPSQIVLGLILVLPLSLICIRAFGEVGNAATDTVGRMSQFIFAWVIPKSAPGALLSNMAVCSFSEAGGWQSAELMGELKMGFLTGVSAKDMLYAQIIGSSLGGVVGGFIYRLYTKVYPIPSDAFPAPHAHMVYSSAMIMYGSGLPTGVAPFAICAGIISAIFTSLRVFGKFSWARYLPQSLAVAIGIYIKPEFTLTRSIGGLIRWYIVDYKKQKELPLISVSTGLILGESILNLVKFALQGLGVPHL